MRCFPWQSLDHQCLVGETPLWRCLGVQDAAGEQFARKPGNLQGSVLRPVPQEQIDHCIAVGIRPGYRDVRVEFRVAPEIEMPPVVVVCREPI